MIQSPIPQLMTLTFMLDCLAFCTITSFKIFFQIQLLAALKITENASNLQSLQESMLSHTYSRSIFKPYRVALQNSFSIGLLYPPAFRQTSSEQIQAHMSSSVNFTNIQQYPTQFSRSLLKMSVPFPKLAVSKRPGARTNCCCKGYMALLDNYFIKFIYKFYVYMQLKNLNIENKHQQRNEICFQYINLYTQQYFVIISLRIQQMSARPSNSADLCSLPDAVQFQFREEQEMHSEITITNLVDRVITFKIKTNKPGLYLVKPMEGQIYNQSTSVIGFKRKELTLDNFNMIVANPGQNREKFLIQFSSEVEDGVGIPQKVGQVAYLAVAFNKNSNKNNPAQPPQGKLPVSSNKSSSKQEDKQKEPELAQTIAEKKSQLQKLILQKQDLLAARINQSTSSKSFTLQDLIYTVIFSFLLGFIII